MPALHGVIHGKTIELEHESGLPEGLRVVIEVRPVDDFPSWLNRFDIDPATKAKRFVIKGSHLSVDDLVQLVEQGRTDAELKQIHPELSPSDLEAVRLYARAPEGMRRSFGGWSENDEGLDDYLEWTRQQRKASRPEIVE